MNQRRSYFSLVASAMLALPAVMPATAAPPDAPWVARDIGTPSAQGSTDVDAAGVWTLRGSGVDIDNEADSFHYAYQRVRGDLSISARFLSRQGGDGEWAKAGLMIRENDTPGSPHLLYTMTTGYGLHTEKRPRDGELTQYFPQVGPSGRLERNLYVQLQRTNNEIAGFYSRDGSLWIQADFSPQRLPTLGEEALVGLALTSHQVRHPRHRRVGHVAWRHLWGLRWSWVADHCSYRIEAADRAPADSEGADDHA